MDGMGPFTLAAFAAILGLFWNVELFRPGTRGLLGKALVFLRYLRCANPMNTGNDFFGLDLVGKNALGNVPSHKRWTCFGSHDKSFQKFRVCFWNMNIYQRISLKKKKKKKDDDTCERKSLLYIVVLV